MKATFFCIFILSLFSFYTADVFADQLYFDDDFNQLNTNTWEIFGPLPDNSAYVKIENGQLLISSPPGVYTSYVRSRFNLFPSEGDFSAVIKFNYPELTFAGTGIVIGDSNPSYPVAFDDPVQSRIITIWQDRTTPLVGLHNRIFFQLLPTLSISQHEAKVTYINQTYSFYLDNNLKYTANFVDRRPTSIWLGNPGPADRAQSWTKLRIDKIQINKILSSPTVQLTTNWDRDHLQVPIDRTARVTVRVTDGTGAPVTGVHVSAEVVNSTVGVLNQASAQTLPNGEAYFIFTPLVDTVAQLQFRVRDTVYPLRLHIYRPPIVIVPGAGASFHPAMFNVRTPFDAHLWTWSPTARNGWDDLIGTLEANGFSHDAQYGDSYTIAFYDWRRSLKNTQNGFSDTVSWYIQPTIDRVLQYRPAGQRVNILAHSYGGLVSRALVTQSDTPRVNQILTFATPHKGSSNVYWIWSGGTMPPVGDAWFRVIADSLLMYYKHRLLVGSVRPVHEVFSNFEDLLPIYDNYIDYDGLFLPTPALYYQNGVLGTSLSESRFEEALARHNIRLTTTYGTGVHSLRTVLVSRPSLVDLALGLWVDGKPLKQQNFVDGDNSVIAESAVVGSHGYAAIAGSHGDIPDLSIGYVASVLKLGTITSSGKRVPKNALGAVLFSPADVRIIGSDDRVVAVSQVWNDTDDTKIAYAFDLPDDIYTARVTGTGDGAYTLYLPFAGEGTFWSLTRSGTTQVNHVDTHPFFLGDLGNFSPEVSESNMMVVLGLYNFKTKRLPIHFILDVPRVFPVSSLSQTEVILNSARLPVVNWVYNRNNRKLTVTLHGRDVGSRLSWDEKKVRLVLIVPGSEKTLYGTRTIALPWRMYRHYFE